MRVCLVGGTGNVSCHDRALSAPLHSSPDLATQRQFAEFFLRDLQIEGSLPAVGQEEMERAAYGAACARTEDAKKTQTNPSRILFVAVCTVEAYPFVWEMGNETGNQRLVPEWLVKSYGIESCIAFNVKLNSNRN